LDKISQVNPSGWYWSPNSLYDKWPLGIYEFAIWHALLRYADSKNECYPGHDLLATKLKISRASVIRHIKKLLDSGLLTQKKRLGNSNVYKINRPEMIPVAHSNTPPSPQQHPPVAHSNTNKTHSTRPTQQDNYSFFPPVKSKAEIVTTQGQLKTTGSLLKKMERFGRIKLKGR